MSAVDARELFCVYPSAEGGVAALQGLTLRVEHGELCVVLGPSGSGKTTLMRVLAGLERPSAGSIIVDGVDLARLPGRQLGAYRARTLGYADQHYWRALAGELSAEQLIGVPLGLAGVPAEARRPRALELLERVGLLDRAGALPGELSGGEQQRIALCAALANRPSLLIADEPTGELDAASAVIVYGLLAELSREQGATALIVSHDERSTEIADRVVHIRDGRVSEERSGGAQTVVVGRGGWLRVPEESLHEAGIADRATVIVRPGLVELRAVEHEASARVEARPLQSAAGARIEARSLVRRYGRETALGGISAVFEPGRLAVVIGPSGSGKSTLLAMLAGLDVPDAGEVVIDEVVLSALDREERARFRRDHIAFIGQSPGLSGFLSARENVELGLALRGIEGADAHSRSLEALAAVGLADHADRRVSVLSAGQRERVGVARALATRPAVILADEPTSRIDVAASYALAGLLAELAATHGTTVVCATHDPVLVSLADDEVQLGTAVPGPECAG